MFMNKLWYYLFSSKKEIQMPNDNNKNEESLVNDTELTNTLKEHTKQIARISSRISQISDDISLLKNDIAGFKRGVARDMKNIVETIQEKE